jgi:Ser/Thr protein kinase RdoA (MazF antagonist)
VSVNLHPYDELTPDVVIGALESLGLTSDRRILPLNSYENRVYQMGIEEGAPVVAKFYRPQRWTRAAIEEEHAFALELAAHEIPVVAPRPYAGNTLFEHHGFLFAVYERRGGRWPELATHVDREWMGRFLGRLHAIGARTLFKQRTLYSVAAWGEEPAQYLLSHEWIPGHLIDAYESLIEDLLDTIHEWLERAGALTFLRLHGDCHPGNILWTDDGPHFVDLDDCMNGPAIQDLWMLLSGTRVEMTEQLGDLLAGYTQFAAFDRAELMIVECLRTLRMIHYAGWLARRWEDPAFPRAFPWFNESRYWEEHILALREQQAAMDEGPLELG